MKSDFIQTNEEIMEETTITADIQPTTEQLLQAMRIIDKQITRATAPEKKILFQRMNEIAGTISQRGRARNYLIIQSLVGD